MKVLRWLKIFTTNCLISWDLPESSSGGFFRQIFIKCVSGDHSAFVKGVKGDRGVKGVVGVGKGVKGVGIC